MAASKESVCSSIINVTTSTETSFQVYQHYAVKISKIIASILRISHSLNNSKIYIIIIQNHKLQNKNIALSQKNNSHTYGSIGVEKESIQKKKRCWEREMILRHGTHGSMFPTKNDQKTLHHKRILNKKSFQCTYLYDGQVILTRYSFLQ